MPRLSQEEINAEVLAVVTAHGGEMSHSALVNVLEERRETRSLIAALPRVIKSGALAARVVALPDEAPVLTYYIPQAADTPPVIESPIPPSHSQPTPADTQPLPPYTGQEA